MDMPLKNVPDCEIRSVIRFLNESTVNMHHQLVTIYSEQCMSEQIVHRLRSQFIEGSTKCHNDMKPEAVDQVHQPISRQS